MAAAESAIGLAIFVMTFRVRGTIAVEFINSIQVESLPMARYVPKCEKTVQALLCRNLNVKSAILPNGADFRRICLQDDLATGFNLGVHKRFFSVCMSKVDRVKLLREGLVVLRMVGSGGSLKNKEEDK
ncbi:hypothetical protein SDJN03_27398, partial [Cucurbita argyrosperma subsp. sororia]